MQKIVGYMRVIRIISALLDVIALMYFALYREYRIFSVNLPSMVILSI